MNAYSRGCVDGREVYEEYPLDDADIRVVSANGLVDDPLEHVVLGQP